MKISEKDKNIRLLRESIQSGKEVAIFVGAGPSIPLGIDNWRDLLLEMAERFGSDVDVDKCIRDSGYPATASEIYRKINRHEDYLQFLHDKCESTNCRFTSFHLTVTEVTQTILTTNFDPAFEEAFTRERKEFSTQKLPIFNPLTLLSGPAIVYLHGNSNDDIYIFRKEEYDAYYPSVSGDGAGSRELETFLRTVLLSMTLIFIGFSFNDTYFADFLKKVLKEESLKEIETYKSLYKGEHPRGSVEHFAIVDESQNIDEVRRMGLKVIGYEEGKHKQIEYILESLQAVQPEVKSLQNAPEIANAR